jgi:Mg2+ and Co2+ transporter CorA
LFRYATSVYGQDVLLGASWDLIWWFIGAGAVFIVAHAVFAAVKPRRSGH